ncbi:MAG: hypothetical protein Q9183_000513 [Haloplaca sp. 2 TL-2023]
MPFPALLSSRRGLVDRVDNDQVGIEPASNGFTTLVPRNRTTPGQHLNEVHYPDLPRPSSGGCISQDHAGAGERNAKEEPGYSAPAIEGWLQDTFDGRSSAVFGEDMGPVTPSCGKDGQTSRPLMVFGQAQRGEVDSPIARSSFSELYSESAASFAPRGQTTDLRKCKAPRLSPVHSQTPAEMELDFEIYDDGSTDRLTNLSPSVELFRKGHRPKRDRCTSYWDEDILPELKQSTEKVTKGTSGRQVLSDLPELTKAKVFMEGVENAQFSFVA